MIHLLNYVMSCLVLVCKQVTEDMREMGGGTLPVVLFCIFSLCFLLLLDKTSVILSMTPWCPKVNTGEQKKQFFATKYKCFMD